MAKYTYADIIIDPNDPRISIGSKYYCGIAPTVALRNANEKSKTMKLIKIKETALNPFVLWGGGLLVVWLSQRRNRG